MKAITFDGAIPRYLLTRAAGAVSSQWITGPARCTRLSHVPEPELPGDRWVRVRTRLGGICGSDLNLVRLRVSPSTSPFSSFPFVVGHENVGTIETVGSAVRGLEPGQRVVANPLLACEVRGLDPPCIHCAAGFPSRCERMTDGALAPGMLLGTTKGLGGSWGQLYVAHESQVVRLPDAVCDRAGLMLEPLASALSPVLAHPPAEGARALVIGAGSIGLLALASLKAVVPTCEVTVLARYPFQAEHAEALDADHVVVTKRSRDYFAELCRLSEGRLLQPVLGKRIHLGGFDTTMVCVGNDTAVDDALRFTRAGGTVLLLGNVWKLGRVDWTPLWMKEITLSGSVCYNVHRHGGQDRATFDVGLELLASGLASRLESMVTHTFPLTELNAALAAASGKSKTRGIKVAFAPGD